MVNAEDVAEGRAELPPGYSLGWSGGQWFLIPESELYAQAELYAPELSGVKPIWDLATSHLYEEAFLYEGPVDILEAEFKGTPGMAGLIRVTMENWFRVRGASLLYLSVWQDKSPLLDKYRIRVIAHGSPAWWVAPLIASLVVLGLILLSKSETAGNWTQKTVRGVAQTAGELAEGAAEGLTKAAKNIGWDLAKAVVPFALIAIVALVIMSQGRKQLRLNPRRSRK